MSTSTISNTAKDGTGAAAAGITVVATLRPGPGWRISDSSEITATAQTTADANGAWSLALEQQANITPASSWWEIEERFNDTPRVWTVSVGAAPSTLLAALTVPSSNPVLAQYITQATADARYQQVGAPYLTQAAGDARYYTQAIADGRFPILLNGGYIQTAKTAAPADGDLSASQLAFWVDNTVGAPKLRVRAKDSAATAFDISPSVYPSHVLIDCATVPLPTSSPSSLLNSAVALTTYDRINTNVAQNDLFLYDIVLGPGTWQMDIYSVQSTNRGIVTPTFAGSNLATYDAYNASAALLQVTRTGLVVTTGGLQRLQLKVTSKNASSSGYVFGVSSLSFTKTA